MKNNTTYVLLLNYNKIDALICEIKKIEFYCNYGLALSYVTPAVGLNFEYRCFLV